VLVLDEGLWSDVPHGGRRKRKPCRNIMGEPEGKRSIRIPRNRWEYYKKIELKGRGSQAKFVWPWISAFLCIK